MSTEATDQFSEGDGIRVDDFDGFKKRNVPSSRPQLVILTCMDYRIPDLSLPTNPAYIVRTAGARALSALESIQLSQKALGTNAVHVYFHTECAVWDPHPHELHGLETESVTDPDVIKTAQAEEDATKYLDRIPLEELLRGEIGILRRRLRRDTEFKGFIYDVETGVSRPVRPV